MVLERVENTLPTGLGRRPSKLRGNGKCGLAKGAGLSLPCNTRVGRYLTLSPRYLRLASHWSTVEFSRDIVVFGVWIRVSRVGDRVFFALFFILQYGILR